MSTLFISDLHLHPSRPQTTEIFLRFLTTRAKNSEGLYILGDFFELWFGDDIQDDHSKKIIQALKAFANTGIPLYFMQGNRDFLIGKQFIKQTSAIFLPDPSVITLYNQKILLMHGDSLCTADKAHQRFRKFVRHPLIKAAFLSLPKTLRQKIANSIRQHSETKSHQSNLAYQVQESAVLNALKKNQAQILIHGHTHVPGIHPISANGLPAKRIVLGEWLTHQGNTLVVSSQGFEFETFS